MKLIKQIYQDKKGNIWEIEKCSLPKKRGYYTFWSADCITLNKSFRDNLKGNLLKQIEK